MIFLSPKRLTVTSAAKEKIKAEFWAAPRVGQVTVLFHAHRSVTKSKSGKVLSERRDFFEWGAHWRSEVPDGALWVIDDCQLAIQDGRWDRSEMLLLDLSDGCFRVKPN